MRHCYGCGLEYGGTAWVEAVVPDKVWNEIRPPGTEEGCGLLCFSCIVDSIRLKTSYTDVPVWLCGTEPVQAREGDPADALSVLRNWPEKES